MSSDYKERVLQATAIEVYIGRYTALKKAGKTYKGLCPFHKEKTPSFTVNPERGLFHCFGCQRGGDLIAFVMEMDRCSFPEALDTLGRFAGIERPREHRQADPNQALFDANDAALKCFRSALASPEGEAARRYLEARAVGGAAVDRFELGAAGRQWDWLALQLGPQRDAARACGLLRRNDRGEDYDFFRGRLIFPIRDVSGRVVGFGGRVLPGDESPAKYINSPDSPVFHKGRTLYGLFQGVAAVRAQRECFLVEGYLDVIGLAQAGVENVAAPLGTALTADHLRLILRYAERLTAIFDGDNAGRKAALRFAKLCLNESVSQAGAILLPPGLDPFDAAARLRPGDLQRLLQARAPADSLVLHEWLFPGLAEEVAPADAEAADFAVFAADLYQGKRPDLYPAGLERRAALDRLFRGVLELERESDRMLLIDAGARLLVLEPAAVRNEFVGQNKGHSQSASSRPVPAGGRRPENNEQPGSAITRPGKRESDGFARVERALVKELLWSPETAALLQDELASLELVDPVADRVWRHLEMRLLTGQLWLAGDLRRLELDDEALAVFSGAELQGESRQKQDPALSAAAVHELLVAHSVLTLKKKVGDLDRRYTVADSVEKAQIIEERNRLLKEQKDLEERQRRVRRL